MQNKLTSICLTLACATLLISGCTTQAWYESMKQSAFNECEKQAPGARDDCLNRVNKKPYDDYAKERAAQKQ